MMDDELRQALLTEAGPDYDPERDGDVVSFLVRRWKREAGRELASMTPEQMNMEAAETLLEHRVLHKLEGHYKPELIDLAYELVDQGLEPKIVAALLEDARKHRYTRAEVEVELKAAMERESKQRREHIEGVTDEELEAEIRRLCEMFRDRGRDD